MNKTVWQSHHTRDTHTPMSAPTSGLRVQSQLPLIRVYAQGSPTLSAKCLVSGSHPTIQVKPQFFHPPGNIKTAQLEVLGYTIPDQAFREWAPLCFLPNLYLSSCSGSYFIVEHSSRARISGPGTQQRFENTYVSRESTAGRHGARSHIPTERFGSELPHSPSGALERPHG